MSEAKKYLKQAELDSALEGTQSRAHGKGTPLREREKKMVPHKWNLSALKTDTIGLHLRAHRATLVALSKNRTVIGHATLRAGIEEPEKLMAEFLKALGTIKTSATKLNITVSGKPMISFQTKAPVAPKNTLVKTFRIQTKQIAKEERDEFFYSVLNEDADGKAGLPEYLVASIPPDFSEKNLGPFRKLKYKIGALDADLFCYARAGSYILQHFVPGELTRFILVMEWEVTHLILLGQDGAIATSAVPIGITAFLEHLASSLNEASVNPTWLEMGALTLSVQDSLDSKQKKILASQAVHSLFVPYAQQIKMRLFAQCGEHNLAPPESFTLLGPGAKLFRIEQLLSLELELHCVSASEVVPPESGGALGAALWEAHEKRINCLPQGHGEKVKLFREGIANLKEKLNKKGPKKQGLKLPEFGFSPVKMILIGVPVLVLTIGYPVWEKSSATSRLQKRRTQFNKLAQLRDSFDAKKKREERVNKKKEVKEKFAIKKVSTTGLLKEVFVTVPPKIRLNFIAIRENLVTMKGSSRNAAEFEKLLEEATQLEHLIDPVPGGIQNEGEKTRFEITWKVKPTPEAAKH